MTNKISPELEKLKAYSKNDIIAAIVACRKEDMIVARILSNLRHVAVTNKNFPDDEIVKALKHMRKNAYDGYTAHLENGGEVDKSEEKYIDILSETLDLINRQKAEIERLKAENRILFRNADTAFQDGLDERRELFEPEIKAEAYKEFAERLKKRKGLFHNLGLSKAGDYYAVAVEVSTIDDLLKEMVGEENNR